AGADDFLAVVEVFRADEADHAVDEQRIERTGHRIGARFQRLLVHAVVGVGRQRRALPGLEIHHVLPDRAAPLRQSGLPRFLQKRKIDAEAAVGGLGAGDRLEYQIDRHALPDQGQGRGDMSQHAALRRNVQPRDQFIQQAQQPGDHGRVVAGRIDADAGIAGPEQET
ncbi:hypothetical protein KXV85_005082, partial [Aspergillus fumigatus]